MTARNLLLWIHIASVGAWLGANFVQLALLPRFGRAEPPAAKAWTDATIWLGERYYPLAGALIAITGVLLVIETPWDWDAGFIWVGIVVVVIGGVMGGAVFGPLAKRRSAALAAGDQGAAEAAQRSIVPAAFVDTALVLTAILAMVSKWWV
jgi:hypothetical protein